VRFAGDLPAEQQVAVEVGIAAVLLIAAVALNHLLQVLPISIAASYNEVTCIRLGSCWVRMRALSRLITLWVVARLPADCSTMTRSPS
jgi:hypothetical protein